MSDTHAAPAGGADTVVSVPVSTPAVADSTPISATEAAKQLASFRWKRDNPEQTETPAAPEAAAAPELAETPDDAQPPADPVETTPEPEPAAEPPIEPPRSWTKEEKEEFATYPREAQEKIARREQDRESALRRSQNEAAEKLKGLTAKEQQAEQVRQQYEQALPNLLHMLQEQQQGEFKDIQTMADVERLAREDWPRYALWDAQQKKIAAVSAEVKATQERQQSEFRNKWSSYASEQDRLLNERAPELADKSKAEKLTKSAQEYLTGEIGFKPEELAQAWNGEASLSLRDHRVQLLILDGVKYREAKANTKPAPKPVPPVQRPGTSKAPTSTADAEVQTAKAAFDRNPSVKNAAALRLARQRAG